jgi:hypothetical protein
MKLKLIALAALAVVSTSSFAAIQDATTGNGELVANFRLYSGAGAANDTGGDDISAMFDLGISMNSFIAQANVSGYTRTWDLTASNYGSAWNTLTTFNPALNGAIEYNVIALDNTNNTTAGGARYLSTAGTPAFASTLTNSAVINMQNMNGYLIANQTRGTHQMETDGASTATSSDPQNTYFGKVNNGPIDGDTWGASSGIPDTTRALNVPQYFHLITTSSTSATAQATRTAFGVDLDEDGLIEFDNNGTGVGGDNELGIWSVNAALGTLTYTAPTLAPVPEPEGIAMVLAGLGVMGTIVRRRKSKAV